MVLIQVYEGELSDNNFLGKLKLTNIPPAPYGEPQIEFVLEIDANGILEQASLNPSPTRTRMADSPTWRFRAWLWKLRSLLKKMRSYDRGDEREFRPRRQNPAHRPRVTRTVR